MPEACKRCGKSIIFAVTKNGKLMPIDALPSEKGNVWLVHEPDGLVRAHVRGKASTAPAGAREGMFIAHFAACSTWQRR